MKKWISMLLAVGMAASLAACGSTATTDSAAASESTADVASTAEAAADTADGESDLAYIQEKGKMTIGYTVYAPMNYTDENGEFVGFDTELATAVCEQLGVEPEFVEINWDAKLLELESKNIDCIWNGMTITPELQEAISISDPYIKNYQVLVIRAADAEKYTSTESLAGAKVDAEAGSAGESTVQNDEFLSQATYTSVVKQTDALLEVKSGAADAAVMDFVLANALAGVGDYSDLMVIPDLELSVEEYGIGFRKGSDVTEKVNQAMQELVDDGTLGTLAEKYELSELLLANQK